MFYHITASETTPAPNTGYGGYTPKPKPDDYNNESFLNPEFQNSFGFYFYMTLNISLGVATIALNLFMLILVHISKSGKLSADFFKILTILLLVMIVLGITQLALFLGANSLMLIRVTKFLICGLIFFCCNYSSLLICFLGFNRLFVIVFSNSFTFLKNQTSLIILLLGLLNAIWAGFVMYWASKYSEKFIEISNIIFFLIPLFSAPFYLIIYSYIKAQQKQSTILNTKSILSKVEQSTIRQGLSILILYSFSLLTHVLSLFLPCDGASRLYFNGVQDFVNSAPQIAIPLSLFFLSREMKVALKKHLPTCCKSKDRTAIATQKNMIFKFVSSK